MGGWSDAGGVPKGNTRRGGDSRGRSGGQWTVERLAALLIVVLAAAVASVGAIAVYRFARVCISYVRVRCRPVDPALRDARGVEHSARWDRLGRPCLAVARAARAVGEQRWRATDLFSLAVTPTKLLRSVVIRWKARRTPVDITIRRADGQLALAAREVTGVDAGKISEIIDSLVTHLDPVKPPASRSCLPRRAVGTAVPAGTARYVNTFVAVPGAEEPVTHLRPGADYEVVLNIGRRVEDSVLPRLEARWPDELLPGGGVWLRATLLLAGTREPCVVPFFLPAEGESFRCGCEPGGGHGPACSQQRWVRFALRTPDRPAVVEGELVIYYEAAAVMAVQLRLPVGQVGGEPHASVIGRLTQTFNDLGKLAGRTASVVVSSETARVVVNGTSFLDNPFVIGSGAADAAAINTRQALLDVHLGGRDGELYSRYDAFGKTHDEYEQDLRRLAREGHELYAGLFKRDTTVEFTLPSLLRHEARLRGRSPVIQVMDDRVDEHAMLWSLLYDLPLGIDTSRYRPCPAVREFGPEGSWTGPVPALCPYDDAHRGRGNVLCPFGFWGLSCIVEQPPTVDRDLETVVFPDADDVEVLAIVGGRTLDKRLTDRHFKRLQEELPARRLHRSTAADGDELADVLAPEAMDVIYFYCHCDYEQRSPDAGADRYLDLGGYIVGPLDIDMWAQTVWNIPHWPYRRPLVVLNGCHTTEFTSHTLNSFVPAFTQWAGAAGVVGTEVDLEQGLAGWAMEELLSRLVDGLPTGEALHGARWAMLRKGNVMGLAYTPHCLANLALRPVS